MDKFETILNKYWGYDTFRPLQREIIESIYEGRDTIALLPTGGGKSITFQVPAIAKSGICIVITPLIALMKDQIDNLKRRGIRALCVHSGMSNKQIDATLDNAVYGRYKFLYISPERAKSAVFRYRFERMKVSFLAIDEAHSISQWGYDFRPDYLLISELRKIHNVPIIAVTASATPDVCNDILNNLKLNEPQIFKFSFERTNLSYLFRFTKEKEDYVLNILKHIKGVVIVYCRLRKECERLAEYLTFNGFPAQYYHGGLSGERRNFIQESWINERVPIIVATNAFGMGIDKSNVRCVIHFDTPDSIEAYYQEAGRAGRDLLPSYAVLLHDNDTRKVIMGHIRNQFPTIPKIKEVYQNICNYFNLGIGEGKGYAYDFDTNDFCVKYRQHPSVLNAVIKILELNNYIFLTEPTDNPTRVIFRVSRDSLYYIQIKEAHLNEFIQVLMRLYSGLFSEFTPIDETYIAVVTGWSLEFINQSLIALGRLRLINYIPKKRTAKIFMNEERLEDENLRIDPNSYSVREEQSRNRVEKMFELIDSKDICRSVLIRKYFGEDNPNDCGSCDVCRERKRVKSYRERIVELLTEKEMTMQQLESILTIPRDQLVAIVDELIENHQLEFNDSFHLRFK